MTATQAKSSAATKTATPVVKTLGVKTGHCMVLIDAPAEFQTNLALPKGVDLHTAARRGVEFDIAMLFVPTAKMLTARLGPLSKSMKPGGSLWVAFPKKGSGMSTDLSDDEVRRIGATIGVGDSKSFIIDKGWSALRIVTPAKA